MLKSRLLAAVFRTALTLGAVSSMAAVPALAAVQDDVASLAAAIQNAVNRAQTLSVGESDADTQQAIKTAVQNVITLSGAYPTTVQAAIALARQALNAQGMLTSPASLALASVSELTMSSLNLGGPASGGSGGAPVGAPASAGGGGGGGTDYRPGT